MLIETLAQPLAHDPPDQIGRAAGVERHDKPHRAGGVGLRKGGARQRGACGGKARKTKEIAARKFFHGRPFCPSLRDGAKAGPGIQISTDLASGFHKP